MLMYSNTKSYVIMKLFQIQYNRADGIKCKKLRLTGTGITPKKTLMHDTHQFATIMSLDALHPSITAITNRLQ